MSYLNLTPSRVESYLRCPWMTYLEGLCDYVPWPNFHNQLGLACHEFVKGLHRPKHSFIGTYAHTAPRFDPNWVAAEWHGFWVGYLRRLPVPTHRVVGNELVKDFSARGLDLGLKYLNIYTSKRRLLALPPDKIEVEIAPTLIPSTGVVLSVRIDQVRPTKDGRGDLLVDLKFSEHRDFSPETEFALRCYALVRRLVVKQEEAGVAVWNVPRDKAGIKLGIYSDADMTTTTNTLRKVGKAMRDRKWDVPGGKPTCDTCQQKEICTHPHKSVELATLARRNTGYKERLPRDRLDIIRERILEVPRTGVVNSSTQTHLFDSLPA